MWFLFAETAALAQPETSSTLTAASDSLAQDQPLFPSLPSSSSPSYITLDSPTCTIVASENSPGFFFSAAVSEKDPISFANTIISAGNVDSIDPGAGSRGRKRTREAPIYPRVSERTRQRRQAYWDKSGTQSAGSSSEAMDNAIWQSRCQFDVELEKHPPDCTPPFFFRYLASGWVPEESYIIRGTAPGIPFGEKAQSQERRSSRQTSPGSSAVTHSRTRARGWGQAPATGRTASRTERTGRS